MPTEEAKKYFDQLKLTFLENWPKEMCSLSMAQVDIPLSQDELRTLAHSVIDWHEIWAEIVDAPPDMQQVKQVLLSKLNDAVAIFPKGAFVRLGSRSPKDSWLGHRKGFKCTTGAHAWALLTDASERIHDDLVQAWHFEYQPHIFVREWIEMPEWAEFRCFQRNRELVGISQYNYLERQAFPELVQDAAGMEWAIRQWWTERFLPVIHLDDVVFDVVAKRMLHGNEVVSEVRLIEINPMNQMTDPCLFDWRDGGDFDGTFRYLTESVPKPDPAALLRKEDAEKLYVSCESAYMGGYSGAEYEAFKAGMRTVCNVLAASRVGGEKATLIVIDEAKLDDDQKERLASLPHLKQVIQEANRANEVEDLGACRMCGHGVGAELGVESTKGYCYQCALGLVGLGLERAAYMLTQAAEIRLEKIEDFLTIALGGREEVGKLELADAERKQAVEAALKKLGWEF